MRTIRSPRSGPTPRRWRRRSGCCASSDRAALAARIQTFTDARVERYWQLLGTINGWPGWEPQVPAFEWFVAALRANR